MSSFKASAINPRIAGVLTRSLYAAGFSLAVSTLSTQAFAGCQYVIDNQWNNGFTAKIKITNDGTTAINGWNISWQYAGDNRITSSYNATLSGTNPYSATNLNWNGAIQPNQSVEFGFQGSKGASAAEVPTVSGAVCGGSTTSSTPTTSTPATSSSRSSSSTPIVVGSSSSVNNGAGVLFSETFENGAVNTQPAGWENFLGYNRNASNTTSGTAYALIDNTKAYSGTKSIHFKGGTAPAQIVRALPAGTQRLYQRAYVNMSVPMGNVRGDNHEHIFGIKKTFDANYEVRVGQIKGVLGTNEVDSDNIAPKQAQWESGPQLAANKWYCLEVAYLADQPYDTLYFWVDGTLVHSVTSSNDWNNNGGLGANWMSDKFNFVMFGFHSFSNRNADVWMDDLVVSTQPIGCGTTPPPTSSSVASLAPSSSSTYSASSRSEGLSSSSVAITNSSVRSSSVISSTSSRSSSSVANNTAWNLNTTDSYLNFVTTKNTHNVEVHSFSGLSGDITSAGVATLTIDLTTVNTGVALRDERMRDLLFQTSTYPTASITVTVPATVISGLAVGQSAATDISASLNLHGVTGTITTKVSVQKLSSSRILVQTLAPVLVKADTYNLTTGVEALRAAVGIASISASVPVDFALVFDAR